MLYKMNVDVPTVQFIFIDTLNSPIAGDRRPSSTRRGPLLASSKIAP